MIISVYEMKKLDLTKGNITKTMIAFALPMILGNLLQQMYNIADTLIVGRALGSGALAAVGSAYALMTFLTSVLLGLCMGSGAVFSICWGEKNMEKLKSAIFTSFVLTALLTVVLNIGVFIFMDNILLLLNVPEEIYGLMRAYVQIIFLGIGFVFLYNFFAALLRAVGNSVIPLIFLAVCAILNIILDLYFVLGCQWGVAGAAAATVISQAVSGIGIGIYTWITQPKLRPGGKKLPYRIDTFKRNGSIFFTDIIAAVRNESGNPYGTGTCQQLRNGRDGSFCRSRKNRLICLYACTGLWQCFFNIYCPKLWGGKEGTH